MLLVGAIALPFAPSSMVGLVGVLVLGLHVIAGLLIGGGGVRDVAALATAPFYVAWKLALAPAIARASRRDAAWVRTERTHGGSR